MRREEVMKKIILNGTKKALILMALLIITVTFNKEYAKAADATITAVNVKTGKETPASENTYTGKIGTADGYNTSSVVEIKTDCSGLLKFGYKGNNSETVYMTLYSDAALTSEVGITSTESSTKESFTDGFSIPEAGVYYLELKSYGNSDIDYTITPYIVSADDSTLEDKEAKVVSLTGYDDSNYYKITLNKAGAVAVCTTDADGKDCYADVDIYKKVNGEMKLVSEGEASVDGTVSGLGKGTYYIKLSEGSSDYYLIGYEFISISEKSGSSKAKAGTMKIGKASKGLILATDKTSKADWYKIKTTKSKEVTVTFSGEVNGGVTLEFMDASGDSFGRLYISDYTKSDSASPYVGTWGSSSGKLPKGTYYMKVTKDSSDVSGYYTITVK